MFVKYAILPHMVMTPDDFQRLNDDDKLVVLDFYEDVAMHYAAAVRGTKAWLTREYRRCLGFHPSEHHAYKAQLQQRVQQPDQEPAA